MQAIDSHGRRRRTVLRQIGTLGALAATGIGLAACSRDEKSAAAGSAGTPGATGGAPAIVKQAGDKVQFKYPDNPTFDLVYLAEQLGYFEGTNTRPRYVGRVAAPQIIPLTGTGEIDFGTRMVPLVISAVAAGAD